MEGRLLFFIVIFLPAFAALGHDIYLFTQDSGMERMQAAIAIGEPPVYAFFADLGFIWTKYHEESFRSTVQTLDPSVWKIVNFLLTQKAVIVGLGFAFLMLFFDYLIRLLYQLKDRSSAKKLKANKKGKNFKYKRK